MTPLSNWTRLIENLLTGVVEADHENSARPLERGEKRVPHSAKVDSHSDVDHCWIWTFKRRYFRFWLITVALVCSLQLLSLVLARRCECIVESAGRFYTVIFSRVVSMSKGIMFVLDPARHAVSRCVAGSSVYFLAWVLMTRLRLSPRLAYGP